jgi:hypothetical protein
MEIHLTGNMERFMWAFDGEAFGPIKKPIAFERGERVRVVLINDTMMAHPIHLHGHFFELVNGQDRPAAEAHDQCRARRQGRLRPDGQRAWRLGLPLPSAAAHARGHVQCRDRAAVRMMIQHEHHQPPDPHAGTIWAVRARRSRADRPRRRTSLQPEAMAAARAQLMKEHGGMTVWTVRADQLEYRSRDGADAQAFEGEAWWGVTRSLKWVVKARGEHVAKTENGDQGGSARGKRRGASSPKRVEGLAGRFRISMSRRACATIWRRRAGSTSIA